MCWQTGWMRAIFCACMALWGQEKIHPCRAIISALCREVDDIPSPTFTLVQPYLAQQGFEVWHIDLYRLEAASEVLALGIEEAFYEACCLIEWPERIIDLLPEKAMHLYLDFGTDTDSRILSLTDGGQMPESGNTKLAAALAELAE